MVRLENSENAQIGRIYTQVKTTHIGIGGSLFRVGESGGRGGGKQTQDFHPGNQGLCPLFSKLLAGERKIWHVFFILKDNGERT